MLIWLNGPFGIGKTSTAEALIGRLSGALLYDPELVGSLLRRLLANVEMPDDYQDLAAWRALVPETARVLRDSYQATLVMPMTVWRRDYLDQLSSAFRRFETDLYVFRLTASEASLRSRILGRPTEDGPHDWCLAHLPSGLQLMQDPAFGDQVDTETHSPADVADAILNAVQATSPLRDPV